MILSESIDIYCERLSSDIFAEPINFITNIAFILSFTLLYRQYKQKTFYSKIIKRYTFLLIGLTLFIGIGSFLFHLYGTLLSAIADVIPIMVFIILYLYLSIRVYLDQSKKISIYSLVAFLILNFLLAFNGIEEISSYIMALFAMLLISFLSYKKKEYDISLGLLMASFLFAISLLFRQIDLLSCTHLAIGTHWLWHILNSILLYMLVILFMDRKLK
ncbi:MAG: ceramidase domain-containing protein [Hyphomicrobiales bacterium]|nr:ceramidase domain-containing protein [Hyphomicrobiales bacterium]